MRYLLLPVFGSADGQRMRRHAMQMEEGRFQACVLVEEVGDI